ncbi:MAG: LptA/OstA family protein [Pseudomonadota bacterium]
MARRNLEFIPSDRTERLTLSALSLVLFASFVTTANAQLTPDTDAPLDITSDRLETEGNIATWIGNVQVLQGESILTTDRLVITQSDDGGIDEIEAIGDVRYSTGKEAIIGERAIYDETQRRIRMIGDVIVTQGEQVLTGHDLTYWIDTGKTLFVGQPGQRIRGVFKTKALENQS